MSDNFDFEFEFENDEEIDEQIDMLIQCIGEVASDQQQKTAIIAPLKLKQIQFVYNVMKYLTRNTGAKVTYALHKPFKSVGSVTVEAKKLEFSNAVWFSRAAEFASNTEIYPLVNGSLRMVFTFHGLTRPIE